MADKGLAAQVTVWRQTQTVSALVTIVNVGKRPLIKEKKSPPHLSSLTQLSSVLSLHVPLAWHSAWNNFRAQYLLNKPITGTERCC